jgi:hypothetical protein
MADIAVQDVPAGGLANVTFTAAAASQTVPAGAGTKQMGGYDLHSVFAIVRNTDAATKDVTIGGGSPVTVPATTGVAIIPVGNTGVNGAAQAITYSATTNVTVALVRLGAGY